jgi:hypothetical protein
MCIEIFEVIIMFCIDVHRIVPVAGRDRRSDYRLVFIQTFIVAPIEKITFRTLFEMFMK